MNVHRGVFLRFPKGDVRMEDGRAAVRREFPGCSPSCAGLSIEPSFGVWSVDGFVEPDAGAGFFGDGGFSQSTSRKHQGDLSILQQITWLLPIYMLINTLLAGGILTMMREKNGTFSAPSFLGGCGAFFIRFLRLFLIFAVAAVVVLSFLGGIMSGIVSSISDNASSELTDYWVSIASWMILVPGRDAYHHGGGLCRRSLSLFRMSTRC